MCLSIPGKVTQIDKDTARVSVGGTIIEANISLLEDVRIDDYILVHSGFALEKIDEEEARATLELFKEYEDFNQILDEEEKDFREGKADKPN
jgi:hydrogenase expression/formation protein HypC